MCSGNMYLRSIREIDDEENHFDIKKKKEEEKRAIQHLLILFPLGLRSLREDMYIVQTDHSMTYTLVLDDDT